MPPTEPFLYTDSATGVVKTRTQFTLYLTLLCVVSLVIGSPVRIPIVVTIRVIFRKLIVSLNTQYCS